MTPTQFHLVESEVCENLVSFQCNVIKIDEGFSFHPFQAGLIYRIHSSGVYIAARKGGILVKDLKVDKGSKPRVGLRFVTPPEILFSALVTKI